MGPGESDGAPPEDGAKKPRPRLTRMLSEMRGGRVVRNWGGPVSWLVMPLQARFPFIFAAVLALGVCAGVTAQAQDAPQNSSSQSQSSQSANAQNSGSQASGSQSSTYGVYTPLDPLAKVRYDNRWDLSLGFAYDHMKAGPTLLEGANLGGLDMDGSYWLGRHWAVEASGRGYVGTSGTHVNDKNGNGGDLQGPMVKQYFFVGGPEWLGPHNKHGAILAHAMFGGVYGNFQKDLLGQAPGYFGFYYNQIAPAAIIGGSFDLNRSEHWVFRINPDAVMTHYNYHPAPPPPVLPSFSQYDVNFAISVGVEYKFTSIKRSTRKANWISGW